MPLIIFDLDGVLVDARELHYEALNRALLSIDQRFVIGREEHLSTYDGLPTTKKLKMLTEAKDLPPSLYDTIWERKQKATRDIIKEQFVHDDEKCSMLQRLKDDGYTIYVASNSVSDTVKLFLYYTGMIEYVDWWISNEDVDKPKPNPEMYLRCMIKAGVTPQDTFIVEDSHHGRKAAILSGANLIPVDNSNSTTYKIVKHYLDDHVVSDVAPKWQGGCMNVLIPMAGAGKRFEEAGYTFPKPLIEVHGKPMIQVVVENLNVEGRFIFVVQREHYEKYNLQYLLQLIAPGCEIVFVDKVTEGAACTTLIAKEFINNDEHLLMANSDQWVDWNSNEFLYSMIADEVDAGIQTFEATHPRWSFAKLGENGFVAEVAEKKPISNLATTGIYYWKHGSDYVKYAEQMIQKNIRVNGEFYVCPVFNEAIADGKHVRAYPAKAMWGLGTPEDLEAFISNGLLK